MTLRQRILRQTMIVTTVMTIVAVSAQTEAADASANGELIGDPFLNYFALGLLFCVVAVLFYGIIAIHDIPGQIAHSRHHPHEDAIPRGRMGQPVHAARAVAVPADLGDGLSAGTRLGHEPQGV
jgi:hypothetical protein